MRRVRHTLKNACRRPWEDLGRRCLGGMSGRVGPPRLRWRFCDGGRLGYRVQKVALEVVLLLSGALGILCLGLCRRLAEVVPHLVVLGKIDLDLRRIHNGIAGMELCPYKPSFREHVVLPGCLVHGPFGIELFLGLSRRWQRYGVGRCSRKTEVRRVREHKPLPLNFHPIPIDS